MSETVSDGIHFDFKCKYRPTRSLRGALHLGARPHGPFLMGGTFPVDGSLRQTGSASQNVSCPQSGTAVDLLNPSAGSLFLHGWLLVGLPALLHLGFGYLKLNKPTNSKHIKTSILNTLHSIGLLRTNWVFFLRCPQWHSVFCFLPSSRAPSA